MGVGVSTVGVMFTLSNASLLSDWMKKQYAYCKVHAHGWHVGRSDRCCTIRLFFPVEMSGHRVLATLESSAKIDEYIVNNLPEAQTVVFCSLATARTKGIIGFEDVPQFKQFLRDEFIRNDFDRKLMNLHEGQLKLASHCTILVLMHETRASTVTIKKFVDKKLQFVDIFPLNPKNEALLRHLRRKCVFDCPHTNF